MATECPTVRTAIETINHAKCGEIVRRNREKRGKSLRWLAAKLNVSPPYLSDLERGRRNWSEDRFNQALKVLDV